MILRTSMITALAFLGLSAMVTAFERVALADAPAFLTAAACEPVIGGRPAAPKGLRIIPGIDDFELSEEISGPYAGEPVYEAAAAGAHAYFDMLSIRSECMVAYSLRNMDQILEFTDFVTKPLDVTYYPGQDSDPRRQDAAKVVIPANTVSLPNNVRLPIPPVGNSSLLVTWDSWLGAEYAVAKTGIGNWKHFQFASPERIWTEVKSDFDKSVANPPSLAMVEVRYYGQPEDGLVGPNVTNRQPLSPMSGQFGIMAETWTRYWAYFNKVGDWHEFSLWVADATRGPVLINDRIQIKPNIPDGANGWQKFWLEFNSSGKGKDEGWPARVAYVRNVVMLRGVTNVPALLQRP